MINAKFLIVAGGWMFTVLVWSIWRFRTPAGESVPTWFRVLMTLNFLLTLWGGAQLALAFTGGMSGAYAQVIAMTIFMGGFLGIFVLWHKPILGFFASPITSAIAGGNTQVIPKPFYSRAHALRKQARCDDALADVDGELEKFPRDAEGWLLKASILAADLHQPQLAFITLQEFIGIAEPSQRSAAYLQQADIQLNLLHDVNAARTTLQRVIDEFPGTDVARMAQQRMAHLPSEGWLNGNPLGDRESLPVLEHSLKIGLTQDLGASQLRPDRDPEEIRQELALQLVQTPADNEAREQLARLYAGPLGRPDLAHSELEILIAGPGQKDREIVRWLNIIADIHLQSPDGLAGARLALERIIERFPGAAGAHMAAQRLSIIRLGLAPVAAEPTLRVGPPTGNVGLQTDRRFSATRAHIPGLLPDPEATDSPKDGRGAS
jgi:hypothetical protein